MLLIYENSLVNEFTKEWPKGRNHILTNNVLRLLRSALRQNDAESAADILNAYNRVIVWHQTLGEPELLGHEEVIDYFNKPNVQQLTANQKTCLLRAIHTLSSVKLFTAKEIGNGDANKFFAEFFSQDDRLENCAKLANFKHRLQTVFTSFYSDVTLEIFEINSETKATEREKQARRTVLSLIKSACDKDIRADLCANITQTIIEVYLEHTTEDKNSALASLVALAESLPDELKVKVQAAISTIRKENSIDQTTNKLTTAFIRLQIATKKIAKDLQKLLALVHEQRGHLTPVQLSETLYALITKQELSLQVTDLLKEVFANHTICFELLLQINYILAKNYNNPDFRKEYGNIQNRYLAKHGNIIGSWIKADEGSLYPPVHLVRVSPTEIMDFILLVASIYDHEGTVLPHFSLLEDQLKNLQALNRVLLQPLTSGPSLLPTVATVEERYHACRERLQSLVNQLQSSPTVPISRDNLALILAINSQLTSFKFILEEILAMTANGTPVAISREELFIPGTNGLNYPSEMVTQTIGEERTRAITTLGETLYNFIIGYSPEVTQRAYKRCIEKRLPIFNLLTPLDIFVLQAQEIVEATDLNEHLEFFRQLQDAESAYKADLLTRIEDPKTEKQEIIAEVKKRYSRAMLESFYRLQETVRDPRWTLFAGIINDSTNEYSLMIDTVKKISGDYYFGSFYKMLEEIESTRRDFEITRLYKELEDILTRKVSGKIPKNAEQFTTKNMPTIINSVTEVYEDIVRKIENIIAILTSTDTNIDRLKNKIANFINKQMLPGSKATIQFTYAAEKGPLRRIGRPTVSTEPSRKGLSLFEPQLSKREQLKKQLIETLLSIAQVMKIPSLYTNQIYFHAAGNDKEITKDKQIQDMATKKRAIEELAAKTQKILNSSRQIGDSILKTITDEAGKRNEQILNLPFTDLQLLQIMLTDIPELRNKLAETPYDEEGIAFGQKIIASFGNIIQNGAEPENGLLFSKNIFLLCRLIIKIHSNDQLDNSDEANQIMNLLIADLEKILERSRQLAEQDPRKIKALSDCYALLKKNRVEDDSQAKEKTFTLEQKT